jgi:hypothetical protein
MLEGTWLGLDFGQWLAIIVAVLLVGAVIRYLLVERPRDRHGAG